ECTEKFLEDSPFHEELWNDFAKGIFYVAGDMDDPRLYERIARRLADISAQRQTGPNVLFYLSTQPSYYTVAIKGIGAANLHKTRDGWRRIVIEKPFGTDGASARELNDAVHQVFPEEEV